MAIGRGVSQIAAVPPDEPTRARRGSVARASSVRSSRTLRLPNFFMRGAWAIDDNGVRACWLRSACDGRSRCDEGLTAARHARERPRNPVQVDAAHMRFMNDSKRTTRRSDGTRVLANQPSTSNGATR